MKQSIKLILGIGALFVMILVQGGVFATGKIAPGETALKSQAETNQMFLLKYSDVIKYVTESATLTTRYKADVSPRIMGLLISVNVESGDKVKSGDVLCEIDAEQARIRSNQARTALLQAKSQLKQATS
jgi:multidrug efflux pump subunit AcrA (membrane-fusion protein)